MLISMWDASREYCGSVNLPGADISMDVAEIGVGRIVIICQGWILLLQDRAGGRFRITAVKQDLQQHKLDSRWQVARPAKFGKI